MTYFSSLNMIKAMKQVGAANALFASPLVASAFESQRVGAALAASGASDLRPRTPGAGPGPVGGQLVGASSALSTLGPGAGVGVGMPDASKDVTSWTVADVLQWLHAINLAQYSHVFAEASVDGEFLFDLDDQVCVSARVCTCVLCEHACVGVRLCVCESMGRGEGGCVLGSRARMAQGAHIFPVAG